MSVDVELLGARTEADQASAFYRNYLTRMVNAYAECVAATSREPQDILAAQVSELMRGECSRLELCNVLGIAIDRLARDGQS